MHISLVALLELFIFFHFALLVHSESLKFIFVCLISVKWKALSFDGCSYRLRMLFGMENMAILEPVRLRTIF